MFNKYLKILFEILPFGEFFLTFEQRFHYIFYEVKIFQKIYNILENVKIGKIFFVGCTFFLVFQKTTQKANFSFPYENAKK